MPDDRIPVGTIDIPADVAVEVMSPTDTAYEVQAQIGLYLRHGFGEVWVVYPNTRAVHVHRTGEPILLVGGSQVLRGRGPLDGFECTVAALFPTEPATPEPPAATPGTLAAP